MHQDLKPISKIASRVQASTTLVIDSMFKDMKANGIDVVGFGARADDRHVGRRCDFPAL